MAADFQIRIANELWKRGVIYWYTQLLLLPFQLKLFRQRLTEHAKEMGEAAPAGISDQGRRRARR
jgi:hypothetical protein